MTTWTDILGDEMGLMFEPYHYPATSQEFTARTGITPSAIYLCDEASGNLVDAVGASDLASTGTPIYRYSSSGRSGLWYDTPGDKHTADVNALGTTSGIYGCVGQITTTGSTIGLMGRVNAALADGVAMYLAAPAAGQLAALIRDSGANSLTISPAQNVFSLGLFLAQIQIDRAASTARMRISWGTGSASASGSIAGFATLDGAAMEFGFGALPGLTATTGSVHYGFVATGSATEGAGVLQSIAESLGWE